MVAKTFKTESIDVGLAPLLSCRSYVRSVCFLVCRPLDYRAPGTLTGNELLVEVAPLCVQWISNIGFEVLPNCTYRAKHVPRSVSKELESLPGKENLEFRRR